MNYHVLPSTDTRVDYNSSKEIFKVIFELRETKCFLDNVSRFQNREFL